MQVSEEANRYTPFYLALRAIDKLGKAKESGSKTSSEELAELEEQCAFAKDKYFERKHQLAEDTLRKAKESGSKTTTEKLAELEEKAAVQKRYLKIKLGEKTQLKIDTASTTHTGERAEKNTRKRDISYVGVKECEIACKIRRV